jgi:superfamily II DNA or RNA helicase
VTLPTGSPAGSDQPALGSLEVDGTPWRLRGTPRRWQEEALRAWKANADRGVVAVTTGAGKTFFAYLCMIDLLSRSPRTRVVILVPTLALLDQWCIGLEEDLGVRQDQIVTFSGRRHAAAAGRINLLVINTAREIAPSLAGSGPSFLIVDECHRASGPVNSRALQGEHSATLGLSATPEGTYDDSFKERVAPSIGPVIYQYGYDDAFADGVIVSFELTNVAIPLISTEQEEYERLSKRIARARTDQRRGLDVGERLKRLLIRRAGVSAGARNRVPVAIRLAVENAGLRTIVFHERIADAEAISDGLRKAGLTVALYHSRLSDPLRVSNLRLFRRGGTDVLVTCRALDEGFNVPEARVAIIASSTASPRQRIQRLGRILRPARGKEVAKVFTLYATDAEEHRLAEESVAMREITRVTWMRASGADRA